MKASLLLLASLTFRTGLATLPHRRQQPDDPSGLDHFVFPQWEIKDFDAGCSPGGCIMTFNFTSSETASGPPPLDASCDIDSARPDWQSCTPLSPSTNPQHQRPSPLPSPSATYSTLFITASPPRPVPHDGDNGNLPLLTPNTAHLHPDDDGVTILNSTLWARPEPVLGSFVVLLQHRYASGAVDATRVYNVTGNVTVDFERVSMPVNVTVRPLDVHETWWWLVGNGTTALGRRAQGGSGECGRVGGRQCRAVRFWKDEDDS